MAETPLMKFNLPDVNEVEAYAVELPDGRVVVRTKDELDHVPVKETPDSAGAE